jgi:hypothetical protein
MGGAPARRPRQGQEQAIMRYNDQYLRWLYKAGQPNRLARLQNQASAAVFAAGIWPRRVAALDVRGRSSGRIISLPVVITEHAADRYLVSMLGEVNWVKNVRAAGGSAVLRHGRREEIRLVEVPVEARPPILRRYLELAPGARPHIPVDRNAPRQAFERIAPDIPVFRITAAATGQTSPAGTRPRLGRSPRAGRS